jgi:hypothetical protein
VLKYCLATTTLLMNQLKLCVGAQKQYYHCANPPIRNGKVRIRRTPHQVIRGGGCNSSTVRPKPPTALEYALPEPPSEYIDGPHITVFPHINSENSVNGDVGGSIGLSDGNVCDQSNGGSSIYDGVDDDYNKGDNDIGDDDDNYQENEGDIQDGNVCDRSTEVVPSMMGQTKMITKATTTLRMTMIMTKKMRVTSKMTVMTYTRMIQLPKPPPK